MSFPKMKEYLLKMFGAYDLRNAEKHKYSKTVSAFDKSLIAISFPGYKADIPAGKYDYRVDLKHEKLDWLSISHVQIIVDLYHKAANHPEMIPDLKNFLIDVVKHGLNVSLPANNALYRYIPGPPPAGELKMRAEKTCNTFKNSSSAYNPEGNAWDYSINELKYLISWIIPQEDINYPMPQYEGRRMPVARYMEALYCAEHHDMGHSLEEVMVRALKHGRRPEDWNDADKGLYAWRQQIS